MNVRKICPVCGFAELDFEPFDKDGLASFDICPSCGTQFGYDDANVSHDALRNNWIEKGMRWSSIGLPRPKDWNPKAQLLNLSLT